MGKGDGRRPSLPQQHALASPGSLHVHRHRHVRLKPPAVVPQVLEQHLVGGGRQQPLILCSDLRCGVPGQQCGPNLRRCNVHRYQTINMSKNTAHL